MATPPPGAMNATGVAIIPLPPGMTQEIFFATEGALLQISIITAVAFAVILWDHLILLPDELKLYRSKGVWDQATSWAFIILRYGGILATLPTLFFTSIASDNCQFAASISQAGAVLVTAASGIIFGARVISIWSNNIMVKGIVALAYVYMVASWIAVSTQYRALTGPPQPIFSNCQLLDIPRWAVLSFASTVVFDAVILALTLAKIRTETTQKSQLAFVVYRDSLLYFLCTAGTNIMVLSVQALDDSHALIKPTVIPFSTIITVTLGGRVFLNLRLFKQRQETKRMIDNYTNVARMGNPPQRSGFGAFFARVSDSGVTGETGETNGMSTTGQMTTLPTYSGVSHNSLPTYSFAFPMGMEPVDEGTEYNTDFSYTEEGLVRSGGEVTYESDSAGMASPISAHPYATSQSRHQSYLNHGQTPLPPAFPPKAPAGPRPYQPPSRTPSNSTSHTKGNRGIPFEYPPPPSPEESQPRQRHQQHQEQYGRVVPIVPNADRKRPL